MKVLSFGRALPAILVIAFGNAAAAQIIGGRETARAGIAVAAVRTARAARSVPALGSVIDPAPLLRLSGQIAGIDAEVAGAKAKVVLEKQQMAQASALYHNRQVISLADYQKAAEDLAANRAMLAVARAKRASLLAQTGAEWGAAMAAAIRSDGGPLPGMAAGKTMLVGVSLPPGTAFAAPPDRLEAEAAGIRIALRLIGPVPKMLGGYPGQAFLYDAAATPGVSIGMIVSASLPVGPVRTGTLVPWSAVLWQNGRAVVFRAAGGGRFEAVPIETDIPTEAGYLVSRRLSSGDRIVVRGAALLAGARHKTGGGKLEDRD
ncbi:MAG TPA: hypothetical protein VGR91_19365 [Stellaceae bacterium]|nr:hypothetical protein [Stellaceae bacterium]